jgi:hypothetical protein
MRVFVMGSNHFQDPASDELFEAASQVGLELIRKGHTILIGTDKHSTVDYHIFKGAKEHTGKTSNIEIHRPDDGPVPFAEEFKIPESDITFTRYPPLGWKVTHMEVLDNADALLIMGSSEAVVISAVAGSKLGKPVIAVGSFGGGAKTIWSYASGRRENFYHGGLTNIDIDKLAEPWRGKASAEHVVSSLEKVQDAVQRTKKLLARRATPPPILLTLLLLMFAGMGSWVLALARGQGLSIFGYHTGFIGMIFIVVCFAGLWGSTLKSVLDLRNGQKVTAQDVLLDIVSGLGAGVISVILYLVLELAVTGKVSNAQEADDFVRVALLVSLVAVFASMYIDTALARFESVRTSVLAGDFGKKGKT